MNLLRKLFLSTYALVGLLCLQVKSQSITQTDLLVVGGGASGTTAAIQASRMGVKVLVVEETEWLGGMLTSAGVSAIDGNHQMPSGLWGEFRQKLYDYYGGPKAVETGWVSNTLFEPSVGNKVLKELASHPNLTIWYRSDWVEVKKEPNGFLVTMQRGGKKALVRSKLLIDATELGDVMAHLKVPYSIGMDSRHDTGEEFAPEEANDIVQDLTYVITLKDFGKGADKTIRRPPGYNPEDFKEACDVSDPSQITGPENNCYQMMQYGRLPNNKYMINWPKGGNDVYINLIEKSPEERQEALKEAKLHTLRFIYYLQKELGFKHLGIAEDEYPTKDHFPMIPYHRESRRLKGLVTLTVNDLIAPYGQKDKDLYRTGIAVGDYPIDHHHLKNPEAPKIDFVRIKVPSYNVPLGSLIPQETDGLIVAEKSISVTNIVNGATRLQPVVLTIGQAAGALAAISLKNNCQPREVNIREVQNALLASKAYLMPFIDVKPDDPWFASIQRIGATGILKGTGIPYKWANQTWFYPEEHINEFDLVTGLSLYYEKLRDFPASGKPVTFEFFLQVLNEVEPGSYEGRVVSDWKRFGFAARVDKATVLNRRQVAVMLDLLLDPFSRSVDFNGRLK